MGTVRITVRTHRQSSRGTGNAPPRSLMGNPFIGDEKETAGKSYLTVSRKVYVPCRHYYQTDSGSAFIRRRTKNAKNGI